jgi:GH35 family endo-1,4-beta-xylanase
MRIITCLLAALIIPLCAASETLPAGGIDLVAPQGKLTAGGGKNGSAVKSPIPGQEFTEAMRITVTNATPDRPWSAYLTAPFTAGSVKKGDRLLVRYMARCVTGGSGLTIAKIQKSRPPHVPLGTTEDAKFGQEWEQVNQALIASTDAPEGTGEVTLFFGKQVQTVEIAGLRVLNYGADFDISKLPRQKVTYEGREPDAPWRKAAFARIEKTRMADYSAQLTGADGKPLANTQVTVELDRHDFGFGTCVTRGMLTKEGPDAERYRDIVRRTCSRVVFENDLKPDSFPHDDKGRAELDKSFAWLKANGITVRGHYLIQEALDGWTRARLGDPAKLRQTYMDSIRERINFIGDRVTEWDVINHPIAWQGAEMLGQKGPSLDTLGMEVFREARRLTKLPLCINEDQLFRPGNQQEKTFELLEKLKRDGVRVDGLGNQAHFNSSFLPSPEELLRVTNRFATVVPKQVVTEFDIVTNGDEQLAADYLRDCLIACFSHHAYDGFLIWGFWENSHWIPEAALWRKDWSVKPIGLAWEEWTTKRFHTRKTLTTDAQGRISWRGFKGTYRLAAGEKSTIPFHPGSTGKQVLVRLP